jgi:2-iminobutanoate/2-iminopropanoate deaminase
MTVEYGLGHAHHIDADSLSASGLSLMTVQSTPSSAEAAFAESARLGRFVVLSGTLGTDASGRIAAGDVKAQTRQVLENLRAAAARAGTELSRAAKINVFLRRASDFAAMNEVYKPFFPSDPPARTTVVTGLRNQAALVEIAAVVVGAGEPREVVHPAGWVPSANPYSYGILSGDTLFLAGLVSRRGTDNSLVAGDVTTQMKTVLANAGELLRAAGMDYGDIVSSRVYITDVASFWTMNEAYRTVFSKDPPARATVRTDLMSPDLNVEITFVAVKDAARRVIGPAGDLPISPGIAAGGRLYLSGVLGNTPETKGNAAAQTAEMMARIGRTLEAGGHGWADVREAFLYVTDMKTRGAVLAEVAKVFPRSLPAGLVVETGLVAGDGLVELMVTAAK